jgi:2-hydroxy-6-oxonona-2,4-dienedioate hydrolase
LPQIDLPSGDNVPPAKLSNGEAGLSAKLPSVEYGRGRLPRAPIVLLPGLFAGAWIWRSTWDHLIARGHSVLQLVEPYASCDTRVASIDTLRRMLTSVLDEYEISRAVLCGNSLGGLVALDTAAHYPNRVEAVVISGCPGLTKTVSLGLRRSGDMSRQRADYIVDRLFYDHSAISEEMIEKSFAIATDRRCAVNMMRYVVATDKYDVRTCLSQIGCCVLMIWGDHDCIAPVEAWEQNLHLVARGSLHKLAACGHSPMIEKPAEFNAILTKFLA